MPNPSILAQQEEEQNTCGPCPYMTLGGCSGSEACRESCPMLGADPVADALTEAQEHVASLKIALALTGADVVKLTAQRDALLDYFNANEMLRVLQPSEVASRMLDVHINEARTAYEKSLCYK